MSSILYENYDIESSIHIDIAHLLLRQYINNVESPTEVQHIYAENFDEEMKHDTQILINQDSFPEMPIDSMEKYMRNMDNNNVPFVLSYNIENGITFNPHHIDYRKVILDLDRITDLILVRPPYVFELFYKGDNDASKFPEWILVGVLIGLPIGFIISSVLSSRKLEDLDTEVQDLRTRQLLKDEIFKLSNNRKPQPRKRRNYKPKNTRKRI